MFLRAYRPADKRLLQQLFFQTVHTVSAGEYSPEQLHAWAPAESDRLRWSRLDEPFCFVVECQRKPVGFIAFRPEGVVDFLYVHADFQGKGIATALYKQAERCARKRRVPALSAEVPPGARGFFEKKGFVPLAETVQTVGGVDFRSYKMEKRLLQEAAVGNRDV